MNDKEWEYLCILLVHLKVFQDGVIKIYLASKYVEKSDKSQQKNSIAFSDQLIGNQRISNYTLNFTFVAHVSLPDFSINCQCINLY